MHQHHEPTGPLARIIAVLEFPAVLIGKAASWLIIPLVVALAYEVVSRYIFNRPTIWAYDMTYMLAGSLFMLGTAYALHRGSHVRVDFLLGSLRPRWQAMLDIVLYLGLYFPAMILFLMRRCALPRSLGRSRNCFPKVHGCRLFTRSKQLSRSRSDCFCFKA